MSDRGGPPTFDPKLNHQALLGECQRMLRESVESLHRRMDRLELSQMQSSTGRDKTPSPGEFTSKREPLKRRGSRQFTRKRSKSEYTSFEPPQHEFLTRREEIARSHALSLYDKLKREDEEYQRRFHSPSKQSSLASKRGSPKEHHDDRIIKARKPCVGPVSCTSRDDLRNRTSTLVNSMVEKVTQVLQSYLEQRDNATPDGQEGDILPRPPLIDEVSVYASTTYALEHLEVQETSSALVQSDEEKVTTFAEPEHVGVEAPARLTFALFSMSSLVQVEQAMVTLSLRYSLPRSIGEFASLQGVCILGVASCWSRLLSNFISGFNALMEHFGIHQIYLDLRGDEQSAFIEVFESPVARFEVLTLALHHDYFELHSSTASSPLLLSYLPTSKACQCEIQVADFFSDLTMQAVWAELMVAICIFRLCKRHAISLVFIKVWLICCSTSALRFEDKSPLRGGE